ncbi:MAG: Trm112 family protein [Pirellulales bacterium]
MNGSQILPRLICPQTHQPLSMADADMVDRVNVAVAGGQLRYADGDAVNDRLDGGLVRGDGLLLYPIIRGIPLLTVDRAIAIDPPAPSE